ncbi:MAG: FAD-dependent oxidoreductase [Methanobacteriota archaeon]
MRIIQHPILSFDRKKKIPFFFNEKKTVAYEGESIAAALHADGVRTLSHSLRYDRPRGFFCGIGKCSSCFMTVDDVPNIRTCIVPVRENMRVREQEKVGELSLKKQPVQKKKTIHNTIVIVGCGPAGMIAALSAVGQGADSVLLIDENPQPGGQLIKQTHKFLGSTVEKAGTRGIHIAVELLKDIQNHQNIHVLLGTTVVGYYMEEKGHHLVAVTRHPNHDQLVDIFCERVVFACGAMENMLAFPGNDLPGIYGAGGVQTLMNVFGVKPGNRVVMVGAGNVGLIVSYQLLQAGVQVDRVVEAMPRIGGYHVHAAKLCRCGVPIITGCTVQEAYGDGKVEGVRVVRLDEQYQPVDGSEEDVVCDTVCLAVGLTPSIRLLEQAGVETRFIPEAGGYVALHDSLMQTSIKGVYVAGDASGIEEASTAMIEGQLAGVSAAYSLGFNKQDAKKVQQQCHDSLAVFRSGPFGRNPRTCKEKIAVCCEEGGWTHY